MPRDIIDKDIHKKRGKRLRECRKLRKMTQEQFAEAIGKTVNHVSMMENGERTINLERAIKFAKILNVSPRYIMLETDLMLERNGSYTSGNYTDNADRSLVQLLLDLGYEVYFYVVKLFDGKMPDVTKHPATSIRWVRNGEIKELPSPYTDWNTLRIKTSLDQLQDFCLDDPKCKLCEDGMISQVVIEQVVMNDITMDYGMFAFITGRLVDYVKYTIDHLHDFMFDFDYRNTMKRTIREMIVDSRSHIGGLTDIEDIANTSLGEEITVQSPDGKMVKLKDYVESGYHQVVKDFNNRIKNKDK